MAKAKVKKKSEPKKAKSAKPKKGGGYFETSRGLALSFLLVCPLLVAYECALIWFPPEEVSAANDFFKEVFTSVFQTRAAIYFNGAVILALITSVIVLGRAGQIKPSYVFPVAFEGALWAGLLIGFGIMLHKQGVLSLYTWQDGTQDVIRSVGAGVYEEILFRLFFMSAVYIIALLLFLPTAKWSELIGERHMGAMAIAVVVSGVAFALCHVGFADPRIKFYIPSGIFFGVLYAGRGLGVAVYTHVIYDVVAFISQSS